MIFVKLNKTCCNLVNFGSCFIVRSLGMGMFFFIGRQTLVCGWVNFPIVWPHTPPPPPPYKRSWSDPPPPGDHLFRSLGKIYKKQIMYFFVSLEKQTFPKKETIIFPDFKQIQILYHYIFIISQLWLTSHPRSTVVLLDTGTPGTSREFYNEDADGETRTRNHSVINRVF